MNQYQLKVSGMKCEGCENRVINSLKTIDNVINVTANHNTGDVVIEFDAAIDQDEIKECISELGFGLIN